MAVLKVAPVTPTITPENRKRAQALRAHDERPSKILMWLVVAAVVAVSLAHRLGWL
jgi:hypothetical protein